MSLLSIVNRVAYQASLPTFRRVKSNTDRTAQELLTMAHEAGEEITRRAEWSMLYDSDTVLSGETSKVLPDNFHRLVEGGAVLLADGSPVMPVKAADQWRILSAVPSANPHFFLTGGTIAFSPALSSVATVHYVSKNWIQSNTSFVDEFVTDDDTTVFTEPLLALGILWRYRRAKGLPYEDILAEFEAELDREIKADRGIS